MNNPIEISVNPANSTAKTIEQFIYPADKRKKAPMLVKLIKDGDWRQTLVFCRTKHGANRLAFYLNGEGITAAPIHGNKSQGARTRALADFKSGEVRVLVATDIAARGIDIPQLPQVVNFELPNVSEDTYTALVARVVLVKWVRQFLWCVMKKSLSYLALNV